MSLQTIQHFRFQIFFGALLTLVALTLSGGSAQAANYPDETCLSNAGNVNVVVFVKVVNHDDSFSHYADNFKFSIESYARGSASNAEKTAFANAQHNSILKRNKGTATALGKNKQTMEVKRKADGTMAAGKGNACRPNSGDPKAAAYAFRDADGTALDCFVPPPGGTRSGCGYNNNIREDNNESYLLSCLASNATAYRLKAVDIFGEGAGSWVAGSGVAWQDNKTYDLESQPGDELNTKERKITFTYKLNNKKKATIRLNADPGGEVEVGNPVNFKLWAETQDTKDTGSDQFTLEIKDENGGGDIPAAADWAPNNRDLAPNRVVPTNAYTYSFTPTKAGRYCMVIKISGLPDDGSGQTYVDTPDGKTRKQCWKVKDSNIPSGDMTVKIEPVVTAGANEVESDEETTYQSYVKVTDYPIFDDQEWYSRGGVSRLPANNVQTNPSYTATQVDSRTASSNLIPGVTCPSASTGSGVVLARSGSDTKLAGPIRIPSRPAPCTPSSAYCDGGGSPPSCTYTEYRYECETGGPTGWTTSSAPSCSDKYECNGTVTYSATQPACDYWKCQFGAFGPINTDIVPGWPDSPAADVFYNAGDPGDTKCEARCDGGSGPRAPRASGQYWDSGDTNCYERPTFEVTCTSSIIDDDVFTPIETTETVNKNGDFCKTTITYTPRLIGQYLCAEMSPNSPDSWTSNVPGNVTNHSWDWVVDPDSDSDCKRIVGKPYVRIFGGDASVGTAIRYGSGICESGPGIIKAHARQIAGEYRGSGATVAAIAYGAIDGFISGHGTSAPSLGLRPGALSFANDGNGTFGGNFGTVSPCLEVPDSAIFDDPNPLNGSTITGKNVAYVTGDVFISENVVYNESWSALTDMPLLQLYVKGNIYISPDVTRLDGMYAALPSGSGLDGKIYTCATGASLGQVQTASWSGCKKQLVVNGSFVAASVHLARDCGTVNKSLSNADERTVFDGSAAEAQTCTDGSGTRAAEVFNYLPESWIRSSFGNPPGSTYDAILNMPPIL